MGRAPSGAGAPSTTGARTAESEWAALVAWRPLQSPHAPRQSTHLTAVGIWIISGGRMLVSIPGRPPEILQQQLIHTHLERRELILEPAGDALSGWEREVLISNEQTVHSGRITRRESSPARSGNDDSLTLAGIGFSLTLEMRGGGALGLPGGEG